MFEFPRECKQLNAKGQLEHLLSLEGLSRQHLLDLFSTARQFIDPHTQQITKVTLGKDHTVALVFFEASTRTKTTFEIAAKHLGCDVVNLAIQTSSAQKGESLIDTAKNLAAMQTSLFVMRHSAAGSAHLVAQTLGHKIGVVNAGDGCHEHPTQALLDLFTIAHFKNDFTKLRVAIVGDILHSRVARSNILGLQCLGVPEIRVIGPKTLVPNTFNQLGVHVTHDLKTGLQDVDVIIMLRLQHERMKGCYLPSTLEYFHYYGLTPDRLRLAASDVLVMHPGPINRGIEIDSRVADGSHSAILQQVHFGIAMRMAVLYTLLQNRSRVT